MRSFFLAPLLLGALGGGCFFLGGSGDGSASFGYVFLTQDPNDPRFAENGQDGADPSTFIALDCVDIGADSIRLRALDAQGNTVAEAEDVCNSINPSGELSADELGIFLADLPPGTYASFAVEVLANGRTLPIRPLEPDATRLSDPNLFGDFLFFASPLAIDAGVTSDLDFAGVAPLGVDLNGDGVRDADELQLFVPLP